MILRRLIPRGSSFVFLADFIEARAYDAPDGNGPFAEGTAWCPARSERTKMFLAAIARDRINDSRLVENEDFVPLIGVVHLSTSLGVFLDIQDRRVFIPANCTAAPTQVFEVGEPATVLVLPRFAEQEGFGTRLVSVRRTSP